MGGTGRWGSGRGASPVPASWPPPPLGGKGALAATALWRGGRAKEGPQLAGPAGGAPRGPGSSHDGPAGVGGGSAGRRGVEGTIGSPGRRGQRAGWGRRRAGGCGEPDSRAGAESGGRWCFYITAGPATREGAERRGGGRGRRGESSSATAAPLISTRRSGPPAQEE